MAPIDPASMAVIRLCERPDCTFIVNNAIEDLKDILQAMSNHILSMHPVSGSSDGGGGGAGAKSNAAIPVLQEDCDEISWSSHGQAQPLSGLIDRSLAKDRSMVKIACIILGRLGHL